MTRIRRRHTPEFKLKAVIEVLKGEKTAAQIASELSIHPAALSEWKKHFTDGGKKLFSRKRKLKQTLKPEKNLNYLSKLED